MSDNIVRFTKEQLKAFLRCEDITPELVNSVDIADSIIYEEWMPSVEDARAAVRNMLEKSPSFLIAEWSAVVTKLLPCFSKSRSVIAFSEAEAVEFVYSTIANNYFFDIGDYEKMCNSGFSATEELLEYIDNFVYNTGRAPADWRLTEWQRKEFVRQWDVNDKLADADEMTLELFRSCVDCLLEQEDEVALQAKAYGCYGGNAAFPCDWEEARRCLAILVERYQSAQAANSLGYICYYGRCSNGIPQYNEALKYFTVGAFNGIAESQYKIADMMRDGKGIPVNSQAAMNIYSDVYRKSYEQFRSGCLCNSFADAALRYGRALMDDELCDYSEDDPLEVLLMARCAIAHRIANDERYGDRKVAGYIEEAISEAREYSGVDIRKKKIMGDMFPIYTLLARRHVLEVSVRVLSGDRCSITVTLPNDKCEFLVIPECDYAQLVNSFVIYGEGVKMVCDDKKSFRFWADRYVRSGDRCDFCYCGELVFSFEAKRFSISPPVLKVS